MRNITFQFLDQGMILNDPGFGFRRIGSGPIPQCRDTYIVVFGQRQELGIFRYEYVDMMLFVWKPVSDVMRLVLHSLFSLSGCWNWHIGLIMGRVFGNWMVHTMFINPN